MRRVFVLLLAIVAMLLPMTAWSGEVTQFVPGREESGPVVLPQVGFKAIVAEYLDPSNTGIGKSLGYLIWREILTAISDQAGAGVVFARPPGDQRFVDLLEQDYHDAAIRLARYQGARMAVWGAVQEEGGHVYVNSYLSVLVEANRAELSLSLATEPFGKTGIEAVIPRTNFNFALTDTTRDKLFMRRLVTRKATALRAAPREDAAVVRRVEAGMVLEATDMEKGWFRVKTSGSVTAYIDNAQVDVPPRQVEANVTKIALWTSPGGGRSGKTAHLKGTYTVLDMRYIQGKGLWYEIKLNGARGWVPATSVRPRFSLPVIHFVAGLYRYQLQRYADAKRELAQFVTAPGVEGDNASLATAYQLMGACELLSQPTYKLGPKTLETFSKAVALTPFDPAAYTLRAVASIGVTAHVGPALDDIKQAFELDPTNAVASTVLRSIYRQLDTSNPSKALSHAVHDLRNPDVATRIHGLMRTYRVQE